MKITIHIGAHTNQGRTFSTFEAANLYCRGLLGRCSDIAYTIRDGGFERYGTIDMEPVSFHARHKGRIFTAHLQTFGRNVLRSISANKFPFNQMAQSERTETETHFVELLALIK